MVVVRVVGGNFLLFDVANRVLLLNIVDIYQRQVNWLTLSGCIDLSLCPNLLLLPLAVVDDDLHQWLLFLAATGLASFGEAWLFCFRGLFSGLNFLLRCVVWRGLLLTLFPHHNFTRAHPAH